MEGNEGTEEFSTESSSTDVFESGTSTCVKVNSSSVKETLETDSSSRDSVLQDSNLSLLEILRSLQKMKEDLFPKF